MKDQMDNNARRGDMRFYKGQAFACTGFASHARRDGTELTLVHWESLCAVCVKAYSFSAPFHVDKIYPIRTCEAHRRKRPARKRARKA